MAEPDGDWRPLLAAMVAAAGGVEMPLCLYDLRPPSGQPWPAGVPSGPGLRDFYARCDGGTLSLQYQWHPLADLKPETRRWAAELPKLSAPGRPWRLPPKAVVLGEDSGGALLVWNVASDRVSLMDWRGGDWEHLGLGFEDFMRTLFFEPDRLNAEADWAEAVRLVAARG